MLKITCVTQVLIASTIHIFQGGYTIDQDSLLPTAVNTLHMHNQ